MPAYTLYYWPIPFRGEFVRWTLAHAGCTWTQADAAEVADIKDAAPDAQPVPHMAPPMLHDTETGTAMAQLPAILHWLAETHDLLPPDGLRRAATVKLVADTNDVLDEMTLNGGQQMWSVEGWAAYRPRLIRWMRLFGETGRRHGLTETGGYMLGTDAAGLADLVTACLWHTMAHRLPHIRDLLLAEAPEVLALSDRIADSPAIADLRADTVARWGHTDWCGGQIEQSLRDAMG